MGVEGGEGWHFNQNPQAESINADNFEAVASALEANFDDKLWEAEELKPERDSTGVERVRCNNSKPKICSKQYWKGSSAVEVSVGSRIKSSKRNWSYPRGQARAKGCSSTSNEGVIDA